MGVTDTPSGTGRARHRVWLPLLVALMSLAALAWIGRTRILRDLAAFWVVSDPLRPADAIAVLGGGLDTRPFTAARLYAKGLASEILVANVKPSPIVEIGILPSQTELTRRVLIKLGVPARAIVGFGHNVANTFDEARALADWARATRAHTIIVPTELFSTRRQRWILNRALAPAGARALIDAVKPLAYDETNWWRHDAGLIDFQNEIVKDAYDWLRS